MPPRRKHSGKMLKQQAELSASLLSNSSNYQGFSGLPPIPKVKVRIKSFKFYLISQESFRFFIFVNIKMGAGLIKIFDQCPLVIHCASTWIHPETKDQLILLGSDLGIYCLNLKMYLNGDSTLELV